MMAHKTVARGDIAVAALFHTNIDPVEFVALGLVEAGIEVGGPGLQLGEPGSCATSCRSVKDRRLMPIVFSLFSLSP